MNTQLFSSFNVMKNKINYFQCNVFSVLSNPFQLKRHINNTVLFVFLLKKTFANDFFTKRYTNFIH